MRNDLRIAGQFNAEIATRFGVPGLTEAIVIDDTSNLMHIIKIEYAIEEDQLYRRMTYTIIAMQSMKKVGTWVNDMAQQLLYKIAIALGGSTLSDAQPFKKVMFVLPNDEIWDDVLPTDKPKRKKAVPKKTVSETPDETPGKETSEEDSNEETDKGDAND